MRLAVFIVLLITCLVLLAPSALAVTFRTTVMDVSVITEETTCLFTVGWERGDMKVTLIAPDGTRIPQDDPPAGVRVASSERIVIFRVENTQPGLWKAELQEYDNGHVGIIVQKLIQPLMVEGVTAQQDGNDIRVNFSLNGEKDKRCEYDVYLTLDGTYQNGRLLASGTTKTGEAVSLRCPGDSVSSYDGWYITVYAECDLDGFTDFHSATSAPFSFANPDAPGQVIALKATLIDEGVRVEWQPPEEDVSGYLAVLYGEDGAVVHSVSMDAGETQAILPFTEMEKMKAAVSAVRESLCGLPATITVDTAVTLSSLVGFDLPDEPAAANDYVVLLYDTGGASVPLVIELDGQQETRTLAGAGALQLPVHNGTNRITVSAEGADDIWVSQSKKWTLDLIPPTLRIYEDWDAITTDSKTILLSGNTDGSAITVNGTSVQAAATGNFSREVSLTVGVNVLNVTVYDASGNTTVYEARVTRRNDMPFPWWLVGGLVVAALGVTVYALTKKRRARS